MNRSLILKDVSFSYAPNNPVLKELNLEIQSGSFTGIAGSNGSGKSTFLYLLNGLIPQLIPGKLAGYVYVDGQNTKKNKVAELARKVGLVFQNPDLAIFNLTVYEEIAFGLKNAGIDDPDSKIKKALSMVGLSGFENRDPQSLSFGEKQRVSLASVLALKTDYILLDEPSAMLDWESSVNLYKLLARINREGKTVIVVEHDTGFLWQYAGQVILFKTGRIAAFGPAKKILRNKKLLADCRVKDPEK